MKIGFDVSQTAESKTGTGFYAEQLITALAEIDSDNEYILLPWFYGYNPPNYQKAVNIKKNNFTTHLVKDYNNDKILKDIDIVQSNNFKFPNNINAKKIVTIYDVAFLDYPEYTTEQNRLACLYGLFDAVNFADYIITISNYSKNRIIHYFPYIDEEKIKVIYLGNRETLLLEEDDKEDIYKLNLDKEEYFLTVGTIEPRKNYHTLLQAYDQYKKKSEKPKKMCIAGGYGWLESDFKNKIKQMKLTDSVILTGYISDKTLSNLYRYCYGFIYTTWYEGFGLPALEAMNFGKAIITSNVSSLPEVVGDAAVLCEPSKAEEFAEAMLLLEKDSLIYDVLKRKSLLRSSFFSWTEAAHKVKALYK